MDNSSKSPQKAQFIVQRSLAEWACAPHDLLPKGYLSERFPNTEIEISCRNTDWRNGLWEYGVVASNNGTPYSQRVAEDLIEGIRRTPNILKVTPHS